MDRSLRPHHTQLSMPMELRQCVSCLGAMYPDSERPRRQCVLSSDGVRCVKCKGIAATRDPQRVRGSRAERVLQELPEDDPSWRVHASCQGADTTVFMADGTPEIVLWGLAVTYCAPCPVFLLCRAAADEHQYEGLWAGAWRALTPAQKYRGPRYVVTDLIMEGEADERWAE